ncbi:hypothetical protein C8F01DRAFT_1238061 [Mycena amicta]|nr:hypothetical protein C8F01DRAFT_1238061 [Mycena amicta]
MSASSSSQAKKLGASITGGSRKQSKSTKKMLQAANVESNAGLKRKGKNEKAKMKNASGGRGSGDAFKVVSLVVLPCGTEFVLTQNGALSLPAGYSKRPTGSEMQMAVLNGLAVVDTVTGISIDRSANHEETVERLTELLPGPFAYFNNIQAESGSNDPAWVLLAPERRHLQVIAVPEPTGGDLDYYKGNATQGFRNHALFFASRVPIPPAYLQKWASPKVSSFLDASQVEDDEEGSESESDSDASISLGRLPAILRNPKKRTFLSDNSDEDGPVKKDQKIALSSRRRSSTRLAASGKKAIDLTKDDTPPRQETPEFLHAPFTQLAGPSAPPNPSPTRSEVDDSSGNPYNKDNVYNFLD